MTSKEALMILFASYNYNGNYQELIEAREKLEKDLQNQEPSIEVNVTDDVAEEEKKEEKVAEQPEAEATEENVKEEENKEEDKVKEEVQEEPADDAEKPQQEEKISEEPQEQEEEKQDKNEQQPEQQEPADESEPDDKDDSDNKAEVEDVADEPSEREKELIAQVETYKEAEQLRELAIMKHQAETQLNDTTNQVHDALIKTIKKYEIPEDKTLNELRAESPEKAAILEGLLAKAQEVIQDTSAQLSAQVEERAKDVLFNKAGKMFEAYKMTEEQANIAAATFINIMNQVGINDLGEDLAAKVKLSVAQAKMDSPDVVEAAPTQEEKVEIEEAKKEEHVQKSEEVKEEVPPAEEEIVEEALPAEEVPHVEEKKPDISEFMEGIEGNAAKASDVNTDNVLAKLNALPFKERTKFYKENMDLINEAMKKARGQA